ncbi:hypothetical protein ACP2W0_05705 [Pseudobacillus badius]|uniref:hypothetical protein n=1 Tax=Bacillus badius TaxID=1455 RepID=UPI0007B09E8F|nr:hypothetical protein [Bacillus badius]KZN98817.1 hypothetical protein A4244_06840 [Bacillus badius]MED0664734.1 hypothetical protein [Bacillus badius]OCS83753.1 hypothetical protein A6M11_06845 [Bacillus badius]OVE52959.1 hypothetical protein B1A98_05030 [Bacillus badius]TDW04994.1 hypothetical protein B0G66_102429 [Bacillus badius]
MDDNKFDRDPMPAGETGMYEETAAELTDPVPSRIDDEERIDDGEDRTTGGRGFGYAGLIVSVLALFIMPVLLGIVGIVLGFFARNRGERMLGAWAIGVGAAAVIMGLFVLPFF